MYRNTASLTSNNVASGPQMPPEKHNSDSEPDYSEILVRKRQQIDAEVAEFKAAKEKEFQDFERNLRKQRQRRKRQSRPSKTGDSDPRPGALSLLALPNKHGVHTNGSADHSRQTDLAAGSRPTAPLSKPTTGVEKLSIKGETLQRSSLTLASPPSPTSPSAPLKAVSQRPPTPGESATRERLGFLAPSEKPPLTPPTPTNETLDPFAGVFTPAYLPLLESRSSTSTVSGSDTPSRHGSISLPGSASNSISPLRRSGRALTEPVIPSTSLPSALRTASGTAMRKRKHVTFQLADSAIVEPSSSYEEMPSPSPKDEGGVEDGIDGLLRADRHSDEDEPAPTQGLAKAVPSPTLRGRLEQRGGVVPGDLTGTVDGGTGVGFFELDEELSSPALDAAEPFVEDSEDEASSPIETRKDDTLSATEEKALLTYEYGGSVPIDIVRPSSSWVGSFGH